MNKLVFGVDTIVYLRSERDDTKFKIKECGVYLTHFGQWEPGFIFEKEDGKQEYVPWFVFEDLYKRGQVWLDGNKDFADFLHRKNVVNA